MVTWSTDCAAQSTIFLSLPLVWEVGELDGFWSTTQLWNSMGLSPRWSFTHWLWKRALSRDITTNCGLVASPSYLHIPFILISQPISPLLQATLLTHFMCILLFVCLFVKWIFLFCMCAFSMYLNGISIPALDFAVNPYYCGYIWCVASDCSQPHGGHTLILSIQLPCGN